MAILRLIGKASFTGNLPTGILVSVKRNGEVESNDETDIAYLGREGFVPLNADGEAPAPTVKPLSFSDMSDKAPEPSAPGAPVGSAYTPLEGTQEVPKAAKENERKDDPLVCSECGKGPFKSRGGLQGHINIVHTAKKAKAKKKRKKFDEV